MEADNTLQALATLPPLESYLCAGCGYFECYDGEQRLFDSALVANAVVHSESWRRVEMASQMGPVSTLAISARHECGRCGSLVYNREACHICGDSNDSSR